MPSSKRDRRLGLTGKFIALTSTAVLATSLGVVAFAIWKGSANTHEAMLQHARALSAFVSESSVYGIYTEDEQTLAEILERLFVDEDVVFGAVLDRHGAVLTSRVLRDRIAPPTLAELAPGGLPEELLVTEFTSAQNGHTYFSIVSPVYGASTGGDDLFLFDDPEPEQEIIGYVQLALSQARMTAYLRDLLLTTLGVAGALVLGIGSLTTLLTRRTIRPVMELVHATREISEGNLNAQVQISTHDEIADLAQSFNLMLYKLRVYQQEEERQKERLETMVTERTAELREMTDQALESARLAQEASRAKSDFLATMSHEIRTPMNGVLGMIELMLQTALTDRQRRCAGTVQRSATSLLSIINDILDFSKGEAGKLQLESTDFELRDAVEEIVELLAEQAHAKGVEINCAFRGDVPSAVTGDPTRLGQVLTNLIGNAIKFTEEGEVTVRIRLASRPDSMKRNETMVHFSVQDSGIGIPEELRPNLFEPFSQADGSMKRKFGGTGLGLAIAAQLAEAMGGVIGVESDEGRGSNFWFTIRLKTRPQDEAGRIQPDQFEGLRVLVASGHATQRQILEDQLRAWGVHADSAPDNARALEQVGQAAAIAPYKLILVDFDLPGTDGVQLARSVRALPEVPLTRTVLLSAMTATVDPQVLRQAGIAQWLHKPVSQRELHRCLRHTVAGRSALPDEEDRIASPDKAAAYFGALVLVAEDNPVNQEVARGMLEALGCEVEIVPSGADAVMAAATSRYEMIFMDCQMPEMDGFEATRRIREAESPGRIPIVALTANAIAGDRERCLDSGMDDYLAKPISQQQLIGVMRQYLDEVEPPERPALEEPPTPAPTQLPEDGAIDFAAVESIRELERAGGRKLLATVIQTYLDTAPELVDAIRSGIEKGDAHGVERAAHQFKSASANLGGHKLAAICKELEELGRSGSTQNADKLLADVEAEYGPVREALEVELEKSQ